MIKTNAVRVLDRLGIRYELREYEVDPDDLSAGTVAAKTGIPPDLDPDRLRALAPL